jgi:hypothetical protein
VNRAVAVVSVNENGVVRPETMAGLGLGDPELAGSVDHGRVRRTERGCHVLAACTGFAGAVVDRSACHAGRVVPHGGGFDW